MSRYTGNSAAQNGIFSDEGARLLNAAGYGSDSDAAGSDAPDDVANGGSGPMEPADAAGNAARTETAPDSLTYVKQFAARTAIYPGGPLSSLSAAAAVGARNGDIHVSSFASSITGALVSADKLLRENDNALLASVSKFDNTPGKPAYLTFDDGPSSMTRQILDILKKRGVRATFFVIGRNIGKYSDIIREMYADGHCIANHSYTHNYTVLYSSASSFRSELKRCDSAINKALGFEYSPGVFRFPGGSTYKLAAKYKSEARNLGYKYYDWNCLNGDAQADLVNKSADGLYDYMVDTFQKQNEVIILMHDSASKQATADMLDRAISYFQNNGYEFKTLDEK
jgi:peptidoglycan/xylan/chitin deacetylase (PgdA/CDA1 family)